MPGEIGVVPGGLTFGMAKNSLRLVSDNGVSDSDPRVMRRTNEATQEILATMIPVNGMLIALVSVVDGYMLLPKEMDSVISVQMLDADTTTQIFGQKDVRQGWYDIVNPFTYLDPSMAHDNPLIDLFYEPDPGDSSILRRRYYYPGLGGTGVQVEGTVVVQVVGPKAYQAIASDDDSLIVQNVPALKLMIQAIERRENGDPTLGKAYKAECFELLTTEVKKHQMDPRWMMNRKASYEADLATYARGTMGWTRARLALEVAGAQSMGKEELTRAIERAEMRLMEMGIWKGCIEEFTAAVVCGHIVMPDRVESILAADLCGTPIPVRSIFFKYLENGPGDWDCSCGGRLEDEGDIVLNDGRRRHKYRLNTGGSTTSIPATVSSGGATSGDTLTADSYLYIGTNARMVALANGVRLEVKDGAGNWVAQNTWTE